MKEKMRFQCKSCKVRSNFVPEYRVRVLRGRSLKEIYFKCPKCFCEGWSRYKRPVKKL
jgi:hypothetical protein